jgi:hypothetical protein
MTIAATWTAAAAPAPSAPPASAPPGLLKRWLPWPKSGGTGGARDTGTGRHRQTFPATENRVRLVNGSQLHELTVALARASVDPRTPAPSFWYEQEEEEWQDEEEAADESGAANPSARRQRQRRQRQREQQQRRQRHRRPLPRAVAVLFVESWRDDHPHSLALRKMFEACVPSFFASESLGFAVASHRALLFSPVAAMAAAPEPPQPRRRSGGGGEGGAGGSSQGGGGGEQGAARQQQQREGETESAAAAEEQEERRQRQQQRRQELRRVAAAVAARPLASAVRALPAVHVFGPAVGKGPGWRDHDKGGSSSNNKREKGNAAAAAAAGGRSSSSPSPSPAPAPAPLLRRARYSGRHHLAPLVRWLADATGETPLLTSDEAARVYCGFEGGAAEAVRAGGRACPLAAEAAKGGSGTTAWRCNFWDGEPTAVELRRAWASPTMWACAAVVLGRAAWCWWSCGSSVAKAARLRWLWRQWRGRWRRHEDDDQRQQGQQHAHAD